LNIFRFLVVVVVVVFKVYRQFLGLSRVFFEIFFDPLLGGTRYDTPKISA